MEAKERKVDVCDDIKDLVVKYCGEQIAEKLDELKVKFIRSGSIYFFDGEIKLTEDIVYRFSFHPCFPFENLKKYFVENAEYRLVRLSEIDDEFQSGQVVDYVRRGVYCYFCGLLFVQFDLFSITIHNLASNTFEYILSSKE